MIHPAVVIRFTIRGMVFANGPGIVACLPFPVNSHSYSHSLPIPWGEGGVNHSSHDFPAKKQETEQVVRNSASVLHSAAVGGSVIGVVRPL